MPQPQHAHHSSQDVTGACMNTLLSYQHRLSGTGNGFLFCGSYSLLSLIHTADAKLSPQISLTCSHSLVDAVYFNFPAELSTLMLCITVILQRS